MKEYQLQHLVHNNKIYIKIQKGMYGLPQSGKIAHTQPKNILNNHSFFTTSLTPGLWCHITRPISFILCVDDFGIQYKHATDIHFLLKY